MIKADSTDRCFLCGRRGALQVHHMMHGSRRKAADRYGLTVHLCIRCHGLLHDRGIYDLELEQLAQEAFEETYSHELWMKEFGKNYKEE